METLKDRANIVVGETSDSGSHDDTNNVERRLIEDAVSCDTRAFKMDAVGLTSLVVSLATFMTTIVTHQIDLNFLLKGLNENRKPSALAT